MQSILSLCVLLSGLYGGPELTNDQKSLVGIKSVGVVVDISGKDPPSDLKNRIQTQIELRLRRAGIPVSAAGTPFLSIAVIVLDSDTFVVEADLREAVMLSRDSTIVCFATTWCADTYLGIRPRSEVGETIRKVVDRKIEKFLNDYYHANPKQPVRPTTQPAGKK